MPKEEWGTKRICPTTGKRFYDLNRTPIVSPSTGEVVDIETARRKMAAAVISRVLPEKDDDVLVDDLEADDDLLETGVADDAELDDDLRPVSRVFTGKPDLYHAWQAVLLPALPLAPSMASALGRGRYVTRW